jgi:hypothetical protein
LGIGRRATEEGAELRRRRGRGKPVTGNWAGEAEGTGMPKREEEEEMPKRRGGGKCANGREDVAKIGRGHTNLEMGNSAAFEEPTRPFIRLTQIWHPADLHKLIEKMEEEEVKRDKAKNREKM